MWLAVKSLSDAIAGVGHLNVRGNGERVGEWEMSLSSLFVVCLLCMSECCVWAFAGGATYCAGCVVATRVSFSLFVAVGEQV